MTVHSLLQNPGQVGRVSDIRYLFCNVWFAPTMVSQLSLMPWVRAHLGRVSKACKVERARQQYTNELTATGQRPGHVQPQ